MRADPEIFTHEFDLKRKSITAGAMCDISVLCYDGKQTIGIRIVRGMHINMHVIINYHTGTHWPTPTTPRTEIYSADIKSSINTCFNNVMKLLKFTINMVKIWQRRIVKPEHFWVVVKHLVGPQ